MLKRVKGVIFFLIIFCLSFQVGLHFWPDFAYVYGIRIDYLSPTLYLLDILIFALFVVSIPKLKKIFVILSFSKTLKILLLLFVLSLVWNVFNSTSPGAHLFGIVKLVEFVFLGFYVAYSFNKEYIRPFIEALSLSAIISSILAILQFINQASIGGIWYYFGERTFNSSTIGISTVNLDSQILRAYGAFPHPNVLAFFLFVAIVFAALRIRFEEKIHEKIFLYSTALISSIALLFTFSRISIFLLITFLFYEIYTNVKSNAIKLGLVFSVFVLFVASYYAFPFSSQFLMRGIDLRFELFEQAFTVVQSSPYFGIGINNFFIHQVPLVRDITPILFQPPHNIYVLSLLSFGLFGWWIFPFVLFVAIKKLIKNLRITNYELRMFKTPVFIVLLGILIVGLFDHFFLTLEQGQIILVIIIGLSFVDFNPERLKKRKGKRRK